MRIAIVTGALAMMAAGAASSSGASGALAAPAVVVTERAGTPVSVYRSTVAWSGLTDDGHWVLRIYDDGRVYTPSLKSSRSRFDVDLGPDRKGRVVAVYSRCRSGSDGCRLYRYRLGGREVRIKGVSRRGYSERHPTIWRSRIAFARHRDSTVASDTDVDRLYIRDTRRTRRVPGGSVPHRDDVTGVVEAGADHLDLRRTRLAFGWWYSRVCPRASDPLDPNSLDVQRQIWLVDTTGRRRRVDSGCADEHDSVTDPTLDRGGLRYLHALAPPPEAAQSRLDSELRTVDSRGRLLSAVRLSEGVTDIAANDKLVVTSGVVGMGHEVAITQRP